MSRKIKPFIVPSQTCQFATESLSRQEDVYIPMSICDGMSVSARKRAFREGAGDHEINVIRFVCDGFFYDVVDMLEICHTEIKKNEGLATAVKMTSISLESLSPLRALSRHVSVLPLGLIWSYLNLTMVSMRSTLYPLFSPTGQTYISKTIVFVYPAAPPLA